MNLKFKKLRPGAKLPARATETSSGLDLCAWGPGKGAGGSVVVATMAEYESEQWLGSDGGISPGWTAVFWTGIAVELPGGFEAQVRGRSSLSKLGLVVHVGTIDNDYRGEIGVCITNAGRKEWAPKPGDRIAQLVIAPVALPDAEWSDELSDTERGAGGFGSTGK